jgi:hypothetical protein
VSNLATVFKIIGPHQTNHTTFLINTDLAALGETFMLWDSSHNKPNGRVSLTISDLDLTLQVLLCENLA